MPTPPERDESPLEEIGETQTLAALLGIAEMVGNLPDTSEFLDAVVRIAPSLVRVDRCVLFTYDEPTREFRVSTAFVPPDQAAAFAGLRLASADMPRVSQRLVGLRLPTFIKDGSRDGGLPAGVAKRLGVRAALLVPLASRGRFLGFLWLDHSAQSHYFTSKEINVLQGIAMQIALALDSAGLAGSLAMERRRTEALARALSDGILVLDPEFRILSMDRAAEDLLGWQSSEVTGRRVQEVFDISEAEAGVAWRKEKEGLSLVSKDLSLRTHDGGHVSCQVLTVPVRGEAGVEQYLYVLRNLAGAKGVHARAMDALRELAMAQGDARPE